MFILPDDFRVVIEAVVVVLPSEYRVVIVPEGIKLDDGFRIAITSDGLRVVISFCSIRVDMSSSGIKVLGAKVKNIFI